MAKARLTLQYADEQEKSVNITMNDDVGEGIEITVSTLPSARPLAIMGVFGMAFHALIRHYSEQGEGGNWTPVLEELYAQVWETQRLLNIEVLFERLIDENELPEDGGIVQ